jgi:hypothetical protein
LYNRVDRGFAGPWRRPSNRDSRDEQQRRVHARAFSAIVSIAFGLMAEVVHYREGQGLHIGLCFANIPTVCESPRRPNEYVSSQ